MFKRISLIISGFLILTTGVIASTGVDFDATFFARNQRGADESRRYADHEVYQQITAQQKKYDERLAGLKETDFDRYAAIKQQSYIADRRVDYLDKNFPEERTVDEVVETFDGHELRRNNIYHRNKTKIIIHHTATDAGKLKNLDDVKQAITAIYKFHALSRGRGDIGYHYIIGPYGNIYEGKAGGPEVRGAHSMYNNMDSIGIALIGNFQYEQPTKQQLESLVKLSAALAQKYKINPMDKATYHRSSDTPPNYIEDVISYTVAGHTDTGRTSCPGANMISKLDSVRQAVVYYIQNNELPKDFFFQDSPSPAPVVPDIQDEDYTNSLADNEGADDEILKFKFRQRQTVNGTNAQVSFPVGIGYAPTACEVVGDSIIVNNCWVRDGKVTFDLQYNKPVATGYRTFVVKTKHKEYRIQARFVWMQDISAMAQVRKDDYIKKTGFKKSGAQIQKIQYKVRLSEAKQLMNQDVKVLLYELSTDYNKWEFTCDEGCDVYVDSIKLQNLQKFEVSHDGQTLSFRYNGKYISANEVNIINSGLVHIDNYNRTSYAGIPWNVFQGDIIIKKDKIKPIGQNVQTQFVMINKLPFDQYMEGMAEANDQQHLTKTKVLSLIVKSYVLFYLNKQNVHPSIPADASYNVVDDARIFQKYVGYGYTQTAKNRYTALDQTKDQIIMYNAYVPVLPYFNCSAGFTWSGQEKYGWIDTPYLQSRLDFTSCENFNGHGVGLSGQGAEYLAQRGIDYTTIIKYYYAGVQIIDIK